MNHSEYHEWLRDGDPYEVMCSNCDRVMGYAEWEDHDCLGASSTEAQAAHEAALDVAAARYLASCNANRRTRYVLLALIAAQGPARMVREANAVLQAAGLTRQEV